MSKNPLINLTEINLDDLVSSFGWQDHRMAAFLLRLFFTGAARKFAMQMLEFDDLVSRYELPGGSKMALDRFASNLELSGTENIPKDGPVLFLSNHPGMVDTLALFSAINRNDLQIIALNRPFLVSLPEVARHLFFLSDDSVQRMKAVKQAAAHLRNGGAVLTFPAGKIEPDPMVYAGAIESLKDWNSSAGVFMRFAPETKIVPVLVSGVLWNQAVTFPLTRIKKEKDEREKMGAAFQLLSHILFNARPLHVKVQFAEPITFEEIGATDSAVIHEKIISRMTGLLAQSDFPAN